MATPISSHSKKKYLLRFIVFSVILFLVIFVVSGVAFLSSMRQVIRVNKGNELTRRLEIKQMKLETSVNNRIELTMRLAESPLIMHFFSDPENPELKTMALEEIDAYRNSFKGSKIFWVNNADKIFYTDDAAPYEVDPDLPVNYWYNMTLHETKTYNFNINYNPDLYVTNLWINAPIFDQQGKPLGIVGTGTDITKFINDLYREHDDKTSFYLFNSSGEITGAKNVELVIDKKHIESELDTLMEILSTAKGLRPNEIRTFDSPLGKVAIGTVPALEWYSVEIWADGIDDYKNHVSIVFMAMLAVVALIIIISNIFVANLLKTLHKIMDSLEATSHYKSEFLARMSHEIRTPMHAILGMSELALREQNIERVHDIKRAGTNLLTIINDILDFSRIEQGKLEIFSEDYLFSELIEDVINTISIKAAESQLEFRVAIDDQIPKSLIGDETRVRQIMLNILNNAVKYTPAGFVALSVNGIEIDADTMNLIIEVTDSGKGIRERDIDRLFKDFEQLSHVANKGIEGTGLGLAITRNLLEAMDGSVAVQSEYGKGSTFTVMLPQGISRKEILDSSSRENNALRFKAPWAKVLVVDDTPINRMVAKGLLELCAIQVHTCTSGEEAVETVKTKEYDLVFMDHMMPGIDGVEAVAIIRKLEGERFQTLPIVALTANAIAGMEEMFLQNGFNDYLSKPIDIQKLNVVLEKWIPAKKET
ncbi:MAG: response regulator [Planctomycetaceae bacterium]|jgi:signal transduction histidine kinase/ActR/RegA family two-component response regulator|nr:response regulator [Planctomycetaceae bacterium]